MIPDYRFIFKATDTGNRRYCVGQLGLGAISSVGLQHELFTIDALLERRDA